MPSPTASEWNGMFHAYTICTLFLFLKYFLTAMYAVNNDDHPEEDKLLPGGENRVNPPDIKRRMRVFVNDLENIPFHTAIFWSAFIVQNFANLNGKSIGQRETVALTALIAIYTGLRMSYTLCYVLALQPFRSICFILANCAVGGAAIVAINSSFSLDTGNFLP